MKPWIALIIGILIGWLIGWLFELWWSRRKRSQEAAPLGAAGAFSTAPVREIELPVPAAAPEAGVDDLVAPAGTAEPVAEGEFEAPPDLNWAELYEETQAVGVEYEPEIDRSASIGAELPDSAAAGLPEEALAAVAPTPDDLIVIEGIGPVYKAKLHEAGITTFARLAASSPAELEAIIQAPAWRKMYFEEWIEQALLLANNEQEKLRELQERLFRRKKSS